MSTTEQQDTMIAEMALEIYPNLFDGPAHKLEGRIATAILSNAVTLEDRIALKLLLDAITGITSDLIDSETNDTIREATVEEAIESVLARPEGHILVDGRRCYVAL